MCIHDSKSQYIIRSNCHDQLKVVIAVPKNNINFSS